MKRESIELLLKTISYRVRVDVVRATTQAGSGHVTSCFSATEIGVVLFLYAMHFDRNNPHNLFQDHCIFSKGHAAPLLYALWKQVGAITEEKLMTLRQQGSIFEGHPSTRFDRIEVATGSLGCGLSMGLGMRLAAHSDGIENKIFVLLGDSECAEGSVWEALQLADYYKVNGLVAVVDFNRLGQRGSTLFDNSAILEKRLAAFGWYVITVDGHAIDQLMNACDQARSMVDRPVAIIAHTVKGKGVAHVENKNGFHGVAFKTEELQSVLDELCEGQQERVSDEQVQKYIENHFKNMEISSVSSVKKVLKSKKNFELYTSPIDYTEPMATRKAYGDALVALQNNFSELMVFDAEVGNSTYAGMYAQKYPDTFVESFVAEQNMVGMAIGATAQGKICFISTFGAFMTRAFDQIRMAGIGQSALRLVGSHCGVSIGQDGPSQMALEDIAMIAAVPHSVIFYPSDAVSTSALVSLMAGHDTALSYLRLTREITPLLHTKKDSFKVGGCHVLAAPDGACALVIAAGITVHEALKAAQLLKIKQISIAIIDLYCVKPLDVETIVAVAKKSGSIIITVEDHYLFGGIGHMVQAAVASHDIHVISLAVTQVPCSGTPDQLRAMAGIDAHAIVETVVCLNQK